MGRWFSGGTPVSSTNKTDCHDIPEILLEVALNTITLTLDWLLSLNSIMIMILSIYISKYFEICNCYLLNISIVQQIMCFCLKILLTDSC